MDGFEKKSNLGFTILWIITILFTIYFLLHIQEKFLNRSYIMIGIVTETYENIKIDSVQKMLDDTQADGYALKGKQYLNDNGYERSNKRLLEDSLNKEFFGITLIVLLSGILHFLFNKINFNNIYRKILMITSWVEHLDGAEEVYELDCFDNYYLDHLVGKLRQKTIKFRQSLSLLQLEKEKSHSFMENISHQLKTPLTSIRLYTEHLYMQEDYEKKRNKLEKCLFQIDKMSNLILDLLKIGKLESGKTKLDIQEYCFKQTLDEIIYSIAPILEEKDMKVLCSGDDTLVMEYDKKWIKECIINILKNSIEHSKIGTTIDIQYAKQTHDYQILIKDEGNGIEELDLDKIFERFYSNGSQNKENSGIGLNLAKQVIKSHYGKIQVHNNKENGVTFVIIIPFLSGKKIYNSYNIY